jgi:hypothetical protein
MFNLFRSYTNQTYIFKMLLYLAMKLKSYLLETGEQSVKPLEGIKEKLK